MRFHVRAVPRDRDGQFVDWRIHVQRRSVLGDLGLVVLVLLLELASCGKVAENDHAPGGTPCVVDTSKVDSCTLL
jgi:hypothetical protein